VKKRQDKQERIGWVSADKQYGGEQSPDGKIVELNAESQLRLLKRNRQLVEEQNQ
jgi:hypothetical protein